MNASADQPEPDPSVERRPDRPADPQAADQQAADPQAAHVPPPPANPGAADAATAGPPRVPDLRDVVLQYAIWMCLSKGFTMDILGWGRRGEFPPQAPDLTRPLVVQDQLPEPGTLFNRGGAIGVVMYPWEHRQSDRGPAAES